MARVPKTTREEHQTPKRVRFRCIVEQGETQAEAAGILNVPRGTATKWIKRRNSDRRTGKRTGRPPNISDEKAEEMIKWMIGYYERRVLPLQDIAKTHGIKACDNTITAAFSRYGYHYHTPDCKPFSPKLQSSNGGPSRFGIGTGRKSIGEEAYIAMSRQFRQKHTEDKCSYAKEAKEEDSIVSSLRSQVAVNLSTVGL